MMLLQQPRSATDTAALLLFTAGHVNDEYQRPLWLYRDHHGSLQGPFSAANMLQWYSMQRLPPDLLVCGITAQTATLPLEAIPIKFYQPLSSLISSTAAGVSYIPLSMAKAPVQSMPPQPQTQIMPGAAQLRQATIPQAGSTLTAGSQRLLQMSSISNQQGQQSLIGPSGTTNAVGTSSMLRQGLPQQQVVMLQQGTQLQSHQQQQHMMQASGGQHIMVAGQQQHLAPQRPAVVIQQQPAYQQQIGVQQLAGAQAQVLLQPVATQQQTQQVVLQQLQHGGTTAPAGIVHVQPSVMGQQAVNVSTAQPSTGQLDAPLQQLMVQQQGAAPQQQQMQQTLLIQQQAQKMASNQQSMLTQQQEPQQQVVQSQQLQACTASLLPNAAKVATSLRVGQQMVERQLQQMHPGVRKAQFGACTVTEQARQYPGAELIQQRLQTGENAAAAHIQQRLEHLASAGVVQGSPRPLTLSRPASSAGLMLLNQSGQQDLQASTTISGPASTGQSGVVSFGPSSVRHHELMGGVSGPPAPTVPVRISPASTGAISLAGTPRLTGPKLSGSSFNNLQQLVQQVAAGSVSGGDAGSAVLDESAPAAPRRSSAPGEGLVSLSVVAAPKAGANVSGAAAHTTTVLAPNFGSGSASSESSLLGMADGVDEALTVPTSPNRGEGVHASAGDDDSAVIDNILFGLVEDVAGDADDSHTSHTDGQSQQKKPHVQLQPATEAAQPSGTGAAAPSAAVRSSAIPSNALATGIITPEAVAAALPAVAAGKTPTTVSPLQAQTQAALQSSAGHGILQNATGPRAADLLHQQQLLQRLQHQQQAAQVSMPQTNQLIHAFGGSLTGGAAVQPGGTLQSDLLRMQGMPTSLTIAHQQQLLQQQQKQQQLLAQQQLLVQQQQQKLLAQQQQQLLAQQQQQQQRLLAQAEAQQQQQMQKLLLQQQLLAQQQQQRLQKQQKLREQMAGLQQQQLLAQPQQQLMATQEHSAPTQLQLQSDLPLLNGTGAPGLLHQPLTGQQQVSAPDSQSHQALQQQGVPPAQGQQTAVEHAASQRMSLLLATDTAGHAERSAGAAGPASSAAAPAVDGEATKLFNPFGMSFMDPNVMAEVPKAQEQQSEQPQGGREQQFVHQHIEQQQQQPVKQLTNQHQLQQLTDQQVMAALTPELAAMGMSVDEQLEVLKQMLGLKQKQTQEHGDQTQAQQPSAATASSATADTSAPPQQQQQMPAQPIQQAAQPPPKPQHVWLQQLAAGKSAADSSKPAPSASGAAPTTGASCQQDQEQHLAAPVASAATASGEEGGSDAGDFDPSMLPADLFDFLDSHNSPKKHLQPVLPDSDALLEAEVPVRSDCTVPCANELQQEQQSKPGRYIPPGLRRSSGAGGPDNDWAAGAGDTKPNSSSGGQHQTAPHAHASSSGLYQHPHARDSSQSPPPGFIGGISSALWRSNDDRLLVHTTPEQEQRILEQQQRLPPHLRIVPPDPPRSSGGDDSTEKGHSWLPPPPPPQSLRAKAKEPASAAGTEDGRNKIKRLLEQAAAAAGCSSPRGAADWSFSQSVPQGNGEVELSNEHSGRFAVESSYDRQQQQWSDGHAVTHERWEESEFGHHHQGRLQHVYEPGNYIHSSGGAARRGWDHDHGNHASAYVEADGSSTKNVGVRGYADQHRRDACEVASRGWDASEHGPRFAPQHGRHNAIAGVNALQRGGAGGCRSSSPPPSNSINRVEDCEPSVDAYEGYGSTEFDDRTRHMPRGSNHLGDSDWHDHAGQPRQGFDEAANRERRGGRKGGYSDWHDEHARSQGPQQAGVARSGALHNTVLDRRSFRTSTREVEADANMTWQQQQLLQEEQPNENALHEVTVASAAAAAAVSPTLKPAWIAAVTAGREREGREVRRGRDEAARHRERSPVDSRHAAGASMYDVLVAAPQPSQHLRSAAHMRGRQGASDAAHTAHPTSYAEFLKQLKEDSSGHQPAHEQHQDWSDEAGWSAEVSPRKPVVAKEAVASAAAAAMAAVQGLKPFCTVAPPRVGKGGRKGPASPGSGSSDKPAPVRTGSGGPQLPSVEETQAAVMAALGAGPAGAPSRTSSVGSTAFVEHLPPQHDTGSFWRTGSGDGPDSRGSSITSGGVGAQQHCTDAAGVGSGPRRGGSSLFSNVIGQLRKQATTTRSDSSGDMEALMSPRLPTEADQAPRHAPRAASHAVATSHHTTPPAPSTYLAAVSGRRSGNDNAADMVLAAIQTTRQRAHAVTARTQSKQGTAGRARQSVEDHHAGKADAAWREADTASPWDE